MEPLHPDSLTAATKRAMRAAGLPAGCRLHDLRHAAAQTLIADGHQVDAVSRMLGHSSVGFTLTVYGNVTDERLATATDALADVYGS